MVEICTDTSKCYVVTETRKFASNGGEVKIWFLKSKCKKLN
jgi:hypothetical protein